MTKLEEVARAIFNVASDDDEDALTWEELATLKAVDEQGQQIIGPSVQDLYRDMARAAVAAMREPSLEMLEEGRRTIGDAQATEEAWEMMIDAALGDAA